MTHTCVIKGDGTLWCWGHNEHGQLGDGTTTNRPVPVQVAGLPGVWAVAVSARGQSTCAIDNINGTVWCWGRNDRGQLGDGTTTDRSVPAPIAGQLSAFDLSVGTDHACFYTSSGGAGGPTAADPGSWYCWGGNEFGQIGDGTNIDRRLPVLAGPNVAPAPGDFDGNNRVLLGASELLGLANDLIPRDDQLHHHRPPPRCPRRTPGRPEAAGNSLDGTYYSGGGQALGDAAIAANTQQISVGTASLKNTNYAKNSATGTTAGSVGWIDADGDATTNGANTGAGAGGRELPIQGTTEALLVALDGVAVLGNTNQTSGTNGLAVQGAQLAVHHYVPSDARFFPGAGAGGSAVAATRTWTLPSVTFAATDVGAKIAVSGAASATDNNVFTIASVTLPSTIVTVQAPATETFGPSVNFTVFSSRVFVVNDGDTTYPRTAYGSVGGVYTFNNSLDVLRLLYGGLHHDGPKNGSTDPEQGTFDAGSDVRRSLADSWGALFSGPVTTPGASLSHVWRPSDSSGTSSAFLSLVGFGTRGIGATTGGGTRTNPFANSGDANGLNATTHQPVQFAANSTVKSNGGAGDFADDDPIRRPALVGPNPATTATASVDLEQVAENDGTLGLVLPAFVPSALDGAIPSATNAYPSKVCTTGKFDLLSPGFVPTGPVGTSPAPEGGPFSGLVFQPYFLDTSVTPNVKHYSCIAKSTNLHPFAAPTPADNRVWNLVVRSDTDGHFLRDANRRFLTRGGVYRIHTAFSNALVTPGVPGSGLVLANQLTGETQAAALVAADPTSITITTRPASSSSPAVAALSLSGQAALGAVGQFSPATASFPTDQNIKNLMIAGASPVYPLAHGLYLNTLVGFTENPPWSEAGILAATGVDPGRRTYAFDVTAHAFVPPVFTWNGSAVVPAPGSVDLGPNSAVRGLQGQEAQIARAFENSDQVGALATTWGFVALPSGVTAVDYPEDLPASALPLNGAGETTNRYASLHAVSTAAFPNPNNEDATVVSPPDALRPYTLSANAPPFPN